MEIAVAGVKNIADFESVFFADLIDAAEGGRQFGARDHTVLHVVSGREPANGAKGVFAALPKQIAFTRVSRNANFASAMKAANLTNIFRVLFDYFTQAVHFEQQDRGAINRKSRVHVRFHGTQRPGIEHFARGGSDSARGDVYHGFRGVVHGLENRKKRFHRLGIARELYGNFGDEGERALGADEKAGKIVTGRIERRTAETHEFPGWQNNLKREYVVGGHSVSQGVWPSGIFRNVAADCAGALAGRIGSEM